MRLEYNENQEKELRITEIEAILENDLYENEVEEHCLEIELQFLQGNKNTYGEPYAFIGTDNVSFDVIYKYEMIDILRHYMIRMEIHSVHI